MNYKRIIINVLVSIFLILFFIICCVMSLYFLKGGFRNIIYGIISIIPVVIGISLLVYGWLRIKSSKKVSNLLLRAIILLLFAFTLGLFLSIRMSKLCLSLSSAECRKNFMCVLKRYKTSSCPTCMDVIYKTKCISIFHDM